MDRFLVAGDEGDLVTHWAMKFYEKHHPYEAGAEGPDRFDCWGLVRAVQRDYYGRDIPAISLPIETHSDARAVIRSALASCGWRRAPAPLEGDGVIMRRPTSDLHVGVWLEIDGGRVLHCIEGAGVVVSSRLQLYAAGFGDIEYYTTEG